MFTLKNEFIMTKEEIENYNSLPENLPQTKLSARQIGFIGDLYRKYISKIDGQSWSMELYRIEQKEKWPSGARMKEHEAKRICLNCLTGENSKKYMNDKEAARHFFSSLHCRESYRRVVAYVWGNPLG